MVPHHVSEIRNVYGYTKCVEPLAEWQRSHKGDKLVIAMEIWKLVYVSLPSFSIRLTPLMCILIENVLNSFSLLGNDSITHLKMVYSPCHVVPIISKSSVISAVFF